MIQGYLNYNMEQNRYGIIDSADLWAYDGLHCGTCFEIKLPNTDEWIQTRIEYSDWDKENRVAAACHGWYLIDLPNTLSDQLKIRMD